MESAPAVAAPTPTGASYASEVPHGIGAQGGGGRGATRPVSSASAPMLSSLCALLPNVARTWRPFRSRTLASSRPLYCDVACDDILFCFT